MKDYPLIEFISDIEFKKWLDKNHNISNGLKLVFYKKHTGKCTFNYRQALDIALCYGWIDSTVRRINDEKYCQVFTPRTNIKNWSEVNKQKVLKLIDEKKMTIHGLNKIDEYLKNGKLSWEPKDLKKSPVIVPDMPDYLKDALQKSEKAKKSFENLAPSYKKAFIKHITSAKQKETRIRRLEKVIVLLEKNEKPSSL